MLDAKGGDFNDDGVDGNLARGGKGLHTPGLHTPGLHTPGLHTSG